MLDDKVIDGMSETDVKDKIHGLITVEQLPKITEKLKSFKAEIDKRVAYITALDVSNDTYKQVKKELALFRKFYTELENSRKEVKKQVLAPYNSFEDVYKDLAQNPLNTAIKSVSAQITEIENQLKQEKSEKVRAYFDEYAQSIGIDFVTYEQANINITMTVTLKNLKEQAKTYIDKTMDDIKLIASQEYKDEIMVEYKQNHNASLSIITVKNRYKAIEMERLQAEKFEEQERASENQSVAVAKVFEQCSSPIEIAAPEGEQVGVSKAEPICCMKFVVYGTKDQLSDFAKIVKNYLNERGMKYE